MTAPGDVCARFGAAPQPPAPGSKVGFGRLGEPRAWPLHGLRHPPEGDTNGWYLWHGGDPTEDADFFAPLHVEHLAQRMPEALPYLALPPGWRFLLAPGREDVWFDASLLSPPD